MGDEDEVRVIGEADVPGGRVLGTVEEGDRLSVILERRIHDGKPATPSSPRLQVRFEDVRDVDAVAEKNMIVDSLLEMVGEPPWHRYVFVDSDPESRSRLEVWAQHVRLRDVPRFNCPCCDFPTLDEEPPGTYEICRVCGWEDDNVQFDDPDFPGGANRESLNEYRTEFARRLENNPSLRAQAEGWRRVDSALGVRES